MGIDLSPELQVKLDRIASQQGSDGKSLVHQAVERFVGYDEWFICQVETGLAQVDRGEGPCCRVYGKPHHSKTAPHLMRVRWTPVAADDLQSIANYLFEKTPASAARLMREIYAVPPSLTRFSRLWPYRKEGSYAREGNAIPPLRSARTSVGMRDCARFGV
jgi:hypothetical protein